MAGSELDWRPTRWARLSKLRGALSPAEWWQLGSMFAVIVALHLIGWITLVFVTWAIAVLVWRYGRIEEKWAPAERAT